VCISSQGTNLESGKRAEREAKLKVIAVLNQKGGSGKTTVATHLARALQLEDRSVILVDSDPQGSARDWAAAKEEHPVLVVGMERANILTRDVKRFSDRDFVIIDGAPQAKELAVAGVKASDLVLIPVQPSPYDIWATEDLVDLVKARVEITEGALKAAFVVSRVIANTRVGKEIFSILEGYGLPVLKSSVTQRVVFAESARNGETALDVLPGGDAAREIRNLAAEVIGLLEG
jgi:chromosome partitioning protein